MQEWSAVAMDENGEFVVAWTSYNQDTANGKNGVFAQRFDNTAAPVGAAFQVNSYTQDNQQRPSVSMDAGGDFVVTWESYQDPAQSDDPAGTTTTYGIFAQRYARESLIGTSTLIGVNGEVGGEFEVNSTLAGNQRFPLVAMDYASDFVIVWSGNGTVPGQADSQGVFYNRYENTTDQAVAIVADTLRVQTDSSTSSSLWLVRNGSFVDAAVPQMIVDFDENLWTKGGQTGANSVLNPDNWEIDRENVPMVGSIASVQFGLDEAYTLGLESSPSGKYEAVVTFDADPSTTALEPLGGGDYTLTIHDTVWDLFRNSFDGTYTGLPGSDFQRTFSISSTIANPSNNVPVAPPGDPASNATDTVVPLTPVGQQDSPVVASDAKGDYVVVWVVYGQAGERGHRRQHRRPTLRRLRAARGHPVHGQLRGRGEPIQPDVAMDANGDFVIVWSGPGTGDLATTNAAGVITSTGGIFGQYYNNLGVPQGEFKVNEYTVNDQDHPSVAMDQNGDFVVTWNSYNNRTGTPDRNGVWARLYNNLRQPQPMSGPSGVTSPYEVANPTAGLNPGVLVNVPAPPSRRTPTWPWTERQLHHCLGERRLGRDRRERLRTAV